MGTKSNIAWNSLFTLGNLFWLLQTIGIGLLGLACIFFLSFGMKLVGVGMVVYAAVASWRMLRQMGSDIKNITKDGDWSIRA